jgi:hypothetical protein
MRSIIRSGYTARRTRKTITVHRKDGTTYRYTRKAGVSRVRPVPTKDVGAIGKLKAGMLTHYHYHPVEATTNRHKALVKAVTKGRENPHSIIRRLTAISTLTKRTLPRASRIYKADARWIHQKYSKMFGRKKMSA